MPDCSVGVSSWDAGAKRQTAERARVVRRESRFAVEAVVRGALVILSLLCLLVVGAGGQQTPNTSDQDRTANQTNSGDQNKPQAQTGTSVKTQAENAALKPVQLFNLLEKKSIVFPDIASSTVALSPAQKLELAVDNTFSVHTLFWAAIGSGFGQAADSPTGFNQGWDGYGKRFGSSMARQSSAQIFGTFAIASALHDDPRFFPEYNPAFRHAIKYSFKRLFITRNDAGLDVPNVPGLLGPLLAEGLANVYWPDRNRSAGDTLYRYGVDLAVRAGGNMFREYWPVVFAKIRHAPPTQGAAH